MEDLTLLGTFEQQLCLWTQAEGLPPTPHPTSHLRTMLWTPRPRLLSWLQCCSSLLLCACCCCCCCSQPGC